MSLSLLNCAWNYNCTTFSGVDVRSSIIVCYCKSLVDVGDVDLFAIDDQFIRNIEPILFYVTCMCGKY